MDDYSHLRGEVHEDEDKISLLDGKTKHHSPEEAKALLATLKKFAGYIEDVRKNNY